VRVTILDMHTGAVQGSGECDGRRYEDMYVKVKVDGRSEADFTFAGAIFPEGEIAQKVSRHLTELRAEVKAAEDRYAKAMYTAVNEYKAFGGTRL